MRAWGRYQTTAVLAGAYRARREDLRVMRTHVLDTERGVVLCGDVKPESLADVYADDAGAVASCPTCAKKDPRGTDRE